MNDVNPASQTIDLNSDVGEGFGRWSIADDNQIMPLISSANIACGFHAGDPVVMIATCSSAHRHGVRIGAHIGYRDLPGFGRRFIDYDPQDLRAETIYQIGAITAAAHSIGAEVTYVKPHGALYNRMAHDEDHAAAVIEGIQATNPSLALMVLSGTPVVDQALEAGLHVIREAFADRVYTPDGTLKSRKYPDAVHHDPELAADQALQLALGQPVLSSAGTPVSIDADSICVHGDNEAALAVVRQIHQLFQHHGIEVAHAH
ncbi:5-oxoprolinase subunit PxpA [Corynebacterium poyangense]|uniref:5-oxoprolinase subunit A n=1 Tax=Corynebacterium poyangense TaxID=2684405 RepID=A0A7H0SN30_9CORY|nr:5-oxoprolinase subunit PxpA [Corynebacterium poyangense]MBZ8176968.1 5-oxoprolinase subunit PxpA [Corynebacterium poyangense]QNQ89955.1 5-oxoprolinase subunit PxpA [Corynebacterium poyangense]